MKTGSPTLGFQHPAANVPQIQPPQPPLQRSALQRHHQRRSGQFLPKLAPGQSQSDMGFRGSPQGHPTPSSHASSPTNMSTRSPMIMQQGGNTPPTSAVLAQPHTQQFQNFARTSQQPPNPSFYQHQQIPPNVHRPAPPPQYHSSGSIQASHPSGNRNNLPGPSSAGAALGSNNVGPSASQYYPSPFQKHIDQLGKFPPNFPIELCSS